MGKGGCNSSGINLMIMLSHANACEKAQLFLKIV
jgi:hypothetical protein